MRGRFIQFGLGLLNLVLVILAIMGSQPVLKRYLHTAGAAVLALIVLIVYTLASKFIERRSPTELAPARELPRFCAGLAIGLGLFSAVMCVLWLVGVYHPAGWGVTSSLLGGLALATVAGVIEEVTFRGLLFRLTSKLLGTWGALILTSVLFGLGHIGNPGATIWSSLAIAIEAGILLGASYAATGGLGVPIGLHIGWNFCEGSIFGMSVSGTTIQPGVIAGSVSGPNVLTGGAFGPENSIVAVILCLAVAIYFLRMMIKTKRVEPPVWTKSLSAEVAMEQGA